MKYIMFLSLIIASNLALADLKSELYLNAKKEYYNENYEEAYYSLEDYVEIYKEFLENRPIIENRIHIVMNYCLFRITFSGIDSEPPPNFP